ncbi:MAG: hypothetical protein ACE5NG_03995 [bacterium]
MELNRQVDQTELDGTAVWRIVSSTQSPMGAATDTFYIDRKNLLPIRRSVQQGPAVIKLDYQSDAIKGTMKMGAQNIPIELSLAAPVLGDGAALEVTLAALPLAAEYETTLRVFDPILRKVRPMALKVTGTETLEVGAGSFETFKVQLEPLDGEAGGGGTMNICLEEPRCVVRNVANLPAMMGGGTVTMELKSIGVTTAK